MQYDIEQGIKQVAEMLRDLASNLESGAIEKLSYSISSETELIDSNDSGRQKRVRTGNFTLTLSYYRPDADQRLPSAKMEDAALENS